jgi:hypothetical protein
MGALWGLGVARSRIQGTSVKRRPRSDCKASKAKIQQLPHVIYLLVLIGKGRIRYQNIMMRNITVLYIFVKIPFIMLHLKA